ncbi:MAG: hypothetical protein MUE85_02145 [Microscillaceae bacterium]|jgi:hypothetical protein|nr:hypothetical protein [Microscillaceae bacterium]
MKKAFELWEYEEIENEFNLTSVENLSLLTEWLNVSIKLSVTEKQTIVDLRNKLRKKADAWNEDELKFFFISPLINLVNYNSDKYSAFTQRPLSAKIKDVEVSGRVEFMLAKGKQNPREPFFFLHEYKQERKRDNDPLGQLLISMLAAQENNTLKHPLYGCYVTGRFWFFVVLEGDKYATSLAYDATQDDIFQIVASLQEIKNYIEKFLI